MRIGLAISINLTSIVLVSEKKQVTNISCNKKKRFNKC